MRLRGLGFGGAYYRNFRVYGLRILALHSTLSQISFQDRSGLGVYGIQGPYKLGIRFFVVKYGFSIYHSFSLKLILDIMYTGCLSILGILWGKDWVFQLLLLRFIGKPLPPTPKNVSFLVVLSLVVAHRTLLFFLSFYLVMFILPEEYILKYSF